MIKWEKEKKGLPNKALCQIEEHIGGMTVRLGNGIFQQSDMDLLIKLEVEKIRLLRISDENYHLNSRITWLEAGDKNTIFFHKFAEHRKNINTIWSLNDLGRTTYNEMEDLQALDSSHFEDFYKNDTNISVWD